MTKEAIINYFETATLPKTATIGGWQVVDVSKFVKSHLLYIKNNRPKLIKPYLERLAELKNYIENV